MSKHTDQATSDANLIAAAPVMFDALIYMNRFVRNGIDGGFIRMPDADESDSAHDALHIIDFAIASARGEV